MKNKISTMRKLQLFGFLFLLPAVCLVLFSTIIPIAWNIVLSLNSWNGTTDMEFVGLANYMTVFSDKASMRAIGYSVIIAVTASITAMIIGVAMALLIYKVTKAEGAVYRFIFYSPVMLPLSVTGLLFTLVLATDTGLLNNLLALAGLENLQHAWLATKHLVLVVIGIVQGWRSSGTVMMIVFTGLVGLPADLFESTRLDGANYWDEVRFIILPLLRPTIQLVFSMTVMSAFKTYDIVYSMTGGGPGNISTTAPIKILNQAFIANKYGIASANSIIYAILVVAVLLIVRKGLGGEMYEY